MSIMSDTATLCDRTAVEQKKGQTTQQSTTLSDSSIAFARKAKEQKWAAPTATRPSFGC